MNFAHIWHVFNFVKWTKIREIRENVYTRKLVRLRYAIKSRSLPNKMKSLSQHVNACQSYS